MKFALYKILRHTIDDQEADFKADCLQLVPKSSLAFGEKIIFTGPQN
jgi:hypothetical protein